MKRHTVWLITLIFICLTLFCNTFQNSFTWDDKSFIVDNRYIRDIGNIPFFFTPQYWQGLFSEHARLEQQVIAIYRPISMITFSLDYFLWKLRPTGFHLTNLLLHISNVILVYFFVHQLLGRADYTGFLKGKNFSWRDSFNPPFLTALFFAAHPIHVESITWIKNRADPLALLFFLLSCLFFARHIQKARNKLDIFSYAASLFCFILGFLSKASAFSLPFVLVAYVLCFLPKEEYKRALIKILPFFVVALLYFVFKATFLKIPLLYGAIPKLDLFAHILIVIKTMGYYMNLSVLPINLNAERIFIIPRSFLEPAIYSSLTLLLLALAVVIKTSTLRIKDSSKRRYSKLLCFSILWFFLTLAPVSNIIFLFSRPIAEQRLYIPSLGFCLVLAMGINKLSSLELGFLTQNRTRLLAGLLSIFVLTFYSVTTIRRNADWRDPLTLWTKTVKNSPHSPRAHNNLADAYEKKGLYDEAIKEYQEALRLNPGRSEFYYNLGNVYYAKGLYEEAIKEYQEALRLDPGKIDTYYNLGNVYDSKGLYDEAIEEYRQALRLDPNNKDVHNNLGNVYEKIGLYDEAIKEYHQALRLDPQFVAAYNNLGYLYIKMEIKLDEAIRLIKKALTLDPGNAEVMDSLGWAYYKKGMLDEALEELKGAAALLPDNAEIKEHLDAVYRALDRNEK